jgi:hypothetical protein
MNTGPGCECQPLSPPGAKTIVCVAIVSPCAASTTTSQRLDDPCVGCRLTANGLKIAGGLTKDELVPDDGVARARPARMAITMTATRTPASACIFGIALTSLVLCIPFAAILEVRSNMIPSFGHAESVFVARSASGETPHGRRAT